MSKHICGCPAWDVFVCKACLEEKPLMRLRYWLKGVFDKVRFVW